MSGKTNLTYEEAIVSERKATEKVQQFPKEFMGPVLHMVQFSAFLHHSFSFGCHHHLKTHVVFQTFGILRPFSAVEHSISMPQTCKIEDSSTYIICNFCSLNGP